MTDLPDKYRGVVEKHVLSLEWMRNALLGMDDLAKPVLGIKAWDDSVVIDFGKKRLVVSVDGPYRKRLVMKSALVHAATDVVVKGARPRFALDTVSGSEKDIGEMILSLKAQALEMEIPLLGGNTMPGEGEASCSLTVVGELLLKEPIRDSGAKKEDYLVVLGEPVWGDQPERLGKAKRLFGVWYKILDLGITINASKDVTKGGLVSAVYEIAKKSGLDYSLEKEIPFSLTRNLDNFLLALPEKEYLKLTDLCRKNDLSLVRIGELF